jgi:chromosome segregation ATPase
MDTQFFSSQIASLTSEQGFTQNEINEASRKISSLSGNEEEGGDTGGLFAAQAQLTNAQIKLAQIRGEISSAQSQLNAAEAKEAQEEFKAKQDEQTKEIEKEEKEKEKHEEELKFLNTNQRFASWCCC